MPTKRGSLWDSISRTGLAALNEFEAGEERKAMDHTFGSIAAVTRSAQEMVKALCDHVDKLEQRLTESPLEYRGVWQQGKAYPARSFVTHAGSVWHTAKSTTRKPGEGDWILAVKRGVDAK